MQGGSSSSRGQSRNGNGSLRWDRRLVPGGNGPITIVYDWGGAGPGVIDYVCCMK